MSGRLPLFHLHGNDEREKGMKLIKESLPERLASAYVGRSLAALEKTFA